MILTNARLVTPGGVDTCWLDVRGDRIAAIGTEPAPEPGIDLGGRLVAPGFVDMHVHGGGGASFADDPHGALDFHRAHGTTTTVASLVTAPLDALAAQIASLVPLVESGTPVVVKS